MKKQIKKTTFVCSNLEHWCPCDFLYSGIPVKHRLASNPAQPRLLLVVMSGMG